MQLKVSEPKDCMSREIVSGLPDSTIFSGILVGVGMW